MIYTSLIGRPKPLSLESIAPRGGRALFLSFSKHDSPSPPPLFRSRPPGIRSSRRFDQISGNNWLVAWPLNSSQTCPQEFLLPLRNNFPLEENNNNKSRKKVASLSFQENLSGIMRIFLLTEKKKKFFLKFIGNT